MTHPLKKNAVGTLIAGLALATPTLAAAQEQPASAPALPALAFHVDLDYQVANHDALSGVGETLMFGVAVRAPSVSRHDYLEVGILHLDIKDTNATTSSVMVGFRSAWRWDRLALHLFGHVHHGDPVPGDDTVLIASFRGSLGVMASMDLVQRDYGTMALGLYGRGTYFDATDGGDRAIAAAGALGLGLLFQ